MRLTTQLLKTVHLGIGEAKKSQKIARGTAVPEDAEAAGGERGS